MEALVKIVVGIAAVFVLVGFFSLIGAIPTMLLWNWLMPELFGLKVVTFWQALGLNLLAGILFKSSSSSSSKK